MGGRGYHDVVNQLIDTGGIDDARAAALADRERALGITIPAAVREWFSFRNSVDLMWNSGCLCQEDIKKLGDPQCLAKGWLVIFGTHCGTGLVPLGQGDDPIVYFTPDIDPRTTDPRLWTQGFAFTCSIYDGIVGHVVVGWETGLRIEAILHGLGGEELLAVTQRFSDTPGPTGFQAFAETTGYGGTIRRFYSLAHQAFLEFQTPDQGDATVISMM
jgi:hypothetical protein